MAEEVELTIGFEQTEVPVGVLFAALRLLERMYYTELFLQLSPEIQTLDRFERYLYEPEEVVSSDNLLVIGELTITPDASSKAKVKTKANHDTLDKATEKAKKYLEGIKKLPPQPPRPTDEAIREILKHVVPMSEALEDRLAGALNVHSKPLRSVNDITL